MTGEELRDSIFQMAVSGQLVPQNPNDEPASILLEQIETEKDKLVKEGKRKRQKKSKILKRDGSFYEVSGRKEICLDEELPFDIPDSWEWSRFFNLTDLYTGNSINKTVKENKYTGLDNGYNYIATKDVGFNKDIDYENGVKIPYEEDFRIAPENSILMCIEGGSAGRKIAKTNQDVCFGNKLCCFTPSLIDQDYIYAFLQNPGFKEIFRNNLTGIIGGVSISKLRNILIPIPPKEEQKRIVNKLNELEPLIQQYSDLYDNLEYLDKEFPSKLRDSILKEAIQGNLTEQNLENESSQELLKDMEVYKNKLLKKKEINVKKHFPKVRKENNSFYQIEKNKKVCLDGELPFSIPDNWSWDYLNNIGFWKSGSTPSRSL